MARLFDPQAFADLTLGKPDLQAELIELFLDQGRRARASMAGLAASGRDPFKDAIHALLGSARIVAAVQLCTVIERAYAQGGWDALPWRQELATAVEQAFTDVEPVLIAFMARVRPPAAP